MKVGKTPAKTKNIGKTLVFVLILFIVCFGGTKAFALDMLGPPTAGMQKGMFRGGIEYNSSKTTIELIEGTGVQYQNGEAVDSRDVDSIKISDFSTNKIYGVVGYGLSETSEVFLRVGMVDSEFGDAIFGANEDFDGSTDFTLGGGIKATFYEGFDLKMGALVQANWAKYDGIIDIPGLSLNDVAQMDLMEMQIAVGVVKMWSERLSIYGGPFVAFINGDFDLTLNRDEEGLLKYNWDINEGPIYGGYIGGQIKVVKNIHCCIEYQHTSDTDTFGVDLMLRY